jgi:hypothetical protein
MIPAEPADQWPGTGPLSPTPRSPVEMVLFGQPSRAAPDLADAEEQEPEQVAGGVIGSSAESTRPVK